MLELAIVAFKILVGLGTAILSVAAGFLTIVGVIKIVEDRKSPKYWKEKDDIEKKKKGLEGDYYLFYVREVVEPNGERRLPIIQAIAKVESRRPNIWRLLRLDYRETTIRILAPRHGEDLSVALKTIRKKFPLEQFSLLDIPNLEDPKLPGLSNEVFDIRGTVFFNKDRFFFQSQGVNNFEHSVHIGVASDTGLYRAFFTISAWLDWKEDPTAAETLFVKRGGPGVEASAERGFRSFKILLRKVRDGQAGKPRVLNPIVLPDKAQADDLLEMLRAELASPNSSGDN